MDGSMPGQFSPFGSNMMLAQLMQDMQVRHQFLSEEVLLHCCCYFFCLCECTSCEGKKSCTSSMWT